MAEKTLETDQVHQVLEEPEEIEEELEDEQVEAWDDWMSDDDEVDPGFLCLFCDLRLGSTDKLFDHCSCHHYFDFDGIRRDLGLDFYQCFKLINYVRCQVAESKCWACAQTFQSKKDLQNHLHASDSFKKGGVLPWEEDKYLKPFMADDALLHSFACEEDEEDCTAYVDKDELLKEIMKNEDLAKSGTKEHSLLESTINEFGDAITKVDISPTDNHDKHLTNGVSVEDRGASKLKQKDKKLRVSFANVAAREIKNANDNYFGAYGSFGIHREMISDKVRTEAYRGAILNNPSLMNQATVMDVGCGTGILSLFAAQAGASRVIAVEASAKMASVARQVVKDNGLLADGGVIDIEKKSSAPITVVQSMVEDADKVVHIPPQSIDVIVSEWMGYCLLYESMLSSVLYARDHWLKPGGAMLPDTASIFAAGFGKGGTSLTFWEDVYGFNMSCIGKEVVEDAAQLPIVDVVNSNDIVTDSILVQAFDLTTMKPDEVDFTASFELKLRSNPPGETTNAKPATWCYGIVLWFETDFTSRFCKEMPTTLSTSPYSPPTHWSQSIFTFHKPIAMTSEKSPAPLASAAAVGTEECPVVALRPRISIVRSSMHRSIDISLEIAGIGLDGRKRSWPVQLFNL